MTQRVRINRLGQFLAAPEHAETRLVDAGSITSFAQLDELLALPAVRFAADSFADGRALSLARQLRLRGFNGEVELAGDILPDQLPMAIAAGIDVVEISEAHAARCNEAQWISKATASRFGYQHSAGRAETSRASDASIA